MPQLPLTGGCQCGKVRYELIGAPLRLYVCHCRECQKQSASAFGISAMLRSTDLRVVSGEPSSWSRTTDAGRTLVCFFCSTCGSRVWHSDKDHEEEIAVKGGSLDEPLDVRDAVHIWTSRKAPGVLIPEHARRYDQEPE